MGNDRLIKNASILVLLLAVMLASGTASAGEPKQHKENGNNPSAGNPAPMPAAYPYAGVIVDPTFPACCYTVPIVAVYQCPAKLVGQPGSPISYFRSDPRHGLLGGQPYLYHR
jgi:hypothetical protein